MLFVYKTQGRIAQLRDDVRRVHRHFLQVAAQQPARAPEIGATFSIVFHPLRMYYFRGKINLLIRVYIARPPVFPAGEESSENVVINIRASMR